MAKAIEIEPRDEWNEKLIQNVHPPDWQNPTPKGRYNLVVIGAGTGGLITALIASSLGARVALIERHLMGGDCLNVGCVPSKAVIRGASRVFEAKQAAELGLEQLERPRRRRGPMPRPARPRPPPPPHRRRLEQQLRPSRPRSSPIQERVSRDRPR